MKKFLALLFVCAGLTAMAGVPQISNKAQFAQNKAKTMGMMQADSKAMTVQKFFEMKKVTPNDNKLLNKAPRRVAEEDILGSKIAFMLAYSYNEDSAAVVADNIFYYGGWNVALDPQGNGVYNVDLYYDGIPFVINADVANNTAEMVVGPLADGETINFGKDTVSSGGTRPTYTVTTTTAELWLVDEDTFDPENMTYTNVDGVIYSDGSIYFEKGYAVYANIHEDIKVYNRNWVLQSSSTNEDSGLITPIFRKTYLMTPSGTHSYVDTYDSSPGENPVYMYQYDDSTVVVWNLFGIGHRGNYMFIYEDGTMHFPNVQYGGDMVSQREYCEANYAGYDWTDADHVTFLAYDESTGKPTTGVEYIEGTVNATTITWPYMSWTWWGYDATPGDEGWVYLYIPPFSDNVLTFTNGDKFLLGYVEDPDIEVVEGDEAYTFNGVSEAGATVYLATYDPETMQLTGLVDNPYVVNRTNEDQIIYLAAYADGFDIGKLSSGWLAFEPFTVPALEVSWTRGDVNRDGTINIGDVTALISHVLSKDYNDAEDFSSEAADVNGDGVWNVGDVTMLIGYVLSKHWPDEQ